MAVHKDFKLIKERKVDKDTILKISQNLMSGRFFVEFSCSSPKLFLQKSFQDNLDGKAKYEMFSKSIKSTDQLIQYFSFKKE